MCLKENYFAQCSLQNKFVHGVDHSSYLKNDLTAESDCGVLCVQTEQEVHSVSSGPIYAKMLHSDGTCFKFQTDCGATVNVVPVSLANVIRKEKSDTFLTMYNKSVIEPIRKCVLELCNPKTNKK